MEGCAYGGGGEVSGFKAFDFWCDSCGLKEEFLVRDRDRVRCPRCHKLMERCMPSVGLVCPTKPGLASGPLKEGGRKMR